jgi:hypothetical protein
MSCARVKKKVESGIPMFHNGRRRLGKRRLSSAPIEGLWHGKCSACGSPAVWMEWTRPGACGCCGKFTIEFTHGQ